MRADMEIDRKRIAAVRTLETLGYTYRNGEWTAPAAAAGTPVPMIGEADDMHGMLMRRADALPGCTEGSAEEDELKGIVDLIEAFEAFEAKRWPPGKDSNELGGKG
jgi:hypothetical protein